MDAELVVRNIAAHWVQAAVLATAALIAIRLLKLDEPRARLAALHVTLAAIVLLPLMQSWKTVESSLEVTTSEAAVQIPTKFFSAVVTVDPAPTIEPSLVVLAIVATGVVMRLLWLFYGVVQLARFRRTAIPVATPAVAEEMEGELCVCARYVQQDRGRGPWTFGLIRPAVALPAGFDALLPAFQRAVICHELLHIKRRDIAIAFLEELAVAALWFHPCVWLLRARIRIAREQAVDARAVAMLGNPDEYVRCLVDMSGHDLAPHFSQAGAGMLRPRELRARVDAIFEEVHMSRTRFAVAASTFLAVTIAAVLLATAGMPLYAQAGAPAATDTPRRQVNRVYPEYPQDALERGIKGVVIVDITVNAAGDVTTGAVASGPHELRASAFKAALAMKFSPGASTTAMQIVVEYVLTERNWGVKIGEALPNIGIRPQNVPADVRRAMEALEAGPPTNPDATGAYRIGNGLTPPKKIKDVPPLYPPIAQQARVQGVVILEARVDEHGNVSDTRVLRSIPLLDQAAIDAVKQWQYTPTMLNGVAVPVLMTATVNFTLRSSVQLKINMPGMPDATLLRIAPNGGVGTIGHPDMSRYGFAPFLDPDPSVETVKVTIYELAEAGTAPRRLGEVELTSGGGMVQSATSPSFGIELVSVNR